MKGIDISENNGVVDWQAVADSGVEFVMVRSTYGSNTKDSMFDANVEGAHNVGLQVGAYHYSYALTEQGAINEALFCKKVIEESGVALELPIFFDMEDADGYKNRQGFSFEPQLITDMCKAFIDNIGLDCGVYASLSWLQGSIDWQSLDCAVWSADWVDVGEKDEHGSILAWREEMQNIDVENIPGTDTIKGYLWQISNRIVIGGKEFDANILY